MKHTLCKIGLIIILPFMNAGIAWADYGYDTKDIYWFSSDTSSLLNRSSVELATKHIKRGIRYAYEALDQELNLVDKLVAYHNLCIGFLAADRPDSAIQFCTRAYELANGSYRVVKVRGTFRIEKLDLDRKNLNYQKQSKLTLKTLIGRNIRHQSSISSRLSMK